MIEDWKEFSLDPLVDFRVKTETRLSGWSSYVQHARDPKSYDGKEVSKDLGIRIGCWFDASWPKAQELIKTAVEDETPAQSSLDPIEWGYLGSRDGEGVDKILSHSCEYKITESDFAEWMKPNLVPPKIASSFFTVKGGNDPLTGERQFAAKMQNIDREIQKSVSRFQKQAGQNDDTIGWRSSNPYCRANDLPPAAIQAQNVFHASILPKSKIYKCSVFTEKHTTDSVADQMKTVQENLQSWDGVKDNVEDLAASPNLRGITQQQQLDKLLGVPDDPLRQ